MAAAQSTHILIVDNQPLFREGLMLMLQSQTDLEIVGAVGTAREARELAIEIALDIAIVDVLIPRASGIGLCAELHELQPMCKVLILSSVDEPSMIAAMFDGCACGYALKSQSTSELVDAIRQVRGGRRYLPPSVPGAAVDAALMVQRARALVRLTPREREVFDLLIRGNTNDEIAVNMFISRRTVETHRQRVMNKLSAHTVAQMQRIAALEA